jgi:pectate lyase
MVCAALLGSTSVIHAQQLAFPSAEGYGKYATGGRGGAVYEVTTLNASGTGSLGEAIGASGPRTVVFKVAGTIAGNFNMGNGDITIAGQTAPGDGICIRGNLSISADNIIIRYIRVRFDPGTGENDAMGGRYQQNIIFDHISASWSTDEVMTFYHNENTTVQWCIISEACEKGTTDSHRFGGIWGNNYGTWHHNLIAHNDSRNPRWASGCGYNDHRNNVLYNWGYESCYGGEAVQDGDRRTPPIEHSTINMVANYYKAGPATEAGVRSRIANPSTRNGDADAGQWWVSDNYVDGYPDVTADNWLGVTQTSSAFRLDAPWDAMAISQQSAADAYQAVLDGAGCSFPNRDAVDARIIEEVRNGTATYGNNGIIDSPSDVGGWPTLATGTAYADSDHDGMADDWESENGLNPDNADDRNTVGDEGYTKLEEYLNSLVEQSTITTGAGNAAVAQSGCEFFEIRRSKSGRVMRFHYQSGRHGMVTLKVYDSLGREAATVTNEFRNAGTYTDMLQTSGLSSGTYQAKLTLMMRDGAGAVVRTARVLVSE